MEAYTKTQITELLLNKRITHLADDVLTLEDGTQLEVECTDYDCCASAGGTWYVGNTDSIDALITAVEITDPSSSRSKSSIVTLSFFIIFTSFFFL